MLIRTITTYETSNLGGGTLRVEHYPDENRVFIETFTPAGVPVGKVEIAALLGANHLSDICQQIADIQRKTNENNG